MYFVEKYVDWHELWKVEALGVFDVIADYASDSDIVVIKQFLNDPDVELMPEECELDCDRITFCFGEHGGQNESDNQGWSRNYWFVFEEDMILITAEYEQG